MTTLAFAARWTAVAACACAALSSYAQNPQTPKADAATTLAPTVVTAGRVQQNLHDVIADMTLIDRQEIEQSGANYVADILARQPGIELVRNGGAGGTTSLYLRGAPSQYTAVLIDGVRVDSQAGSGGVAWSNIPAAQIDRIEIVRGPSAAVYGSDAMAGVIQIFTRQGQQGFHPSVELGVGSNSSHKINASLRGGTEAITYALNLAHDKSKGFDNRPNIATANHDRDGWKNTSANLNLNWQLNEQHRLSLTALDSEGQAQYDTSAADDRTYNDTRTLGLNWQAQWTPQYQSRLSYSKGQENYETHPSPYRTETTINSYLWHNEYRQGGHLLSAAVERREDKVNNTSLSPSPKADRSQNAIALGYGLQTGAHHVQLNVRQDHDSDWGHKSTGSLGYALNFGGHWRLSASTGTAFRAPTLYQRFSPYGSANLQPEKGYSQELGLRWAKAGHTASATLFHNRYSNQISFGPAGPCSASFGCYVNVAKAKNTGLSLSASTHVAAWRFGANIDWQNPKNDITGKLLARRARHNSKLTADTQIAGFTLGAELQHKGKRFDGEGEVRPLSSYTLLNLHASKPLAQGWTWVGRIDNASKESYETAQNYATGGRQAYVGLRWSLD